MMIPLSMAISMVISMMISMVLMFHHENIDDDIYDVISDDNIDHGNIDDNDFAIHFPSHFLIKAGLCYC